MKDLDFLGAKDLLFLRTLLRVSKQGISSFFCLALFVIDLELVARELLGPVDLSKAPTLCVHELAEVVVPGKYEHLMLRPF